MDGQPAGFGFKPLYRQVRDELIRRIVDRAWPPGGPIPSEMELAAELKVSQGTVRKALDAMAAENLVVRRQGRGTFVASHDEERILFQFFKLTSDTGARVFPESKVLSASETEANAAERKVLNLAAGAEVVRIRRVRSLDTRPILVETIVVPVRLFPGLAQRAIPNNLYGLYSDAYGIGVARAEERLKAVLVDAEDARHLACEPGRPALLIDRTALALDETVVEWRVSVCLTEGQHYRSDLR